MPKSSAGSARASKVTRPAKSVKKTVKKTVKKPVKKLAKKIAKKVVKKTAKKSAKQAVKKSGDKHVMNTAHAALPAIDTKAPAFRLADETGTVRSLADFSGKTLVVYFYPKDDTPGCTQESCDFRDNLNRLTASGAAVVGVSADSVESHRKFKAKHGLNFPLLSDPEHAMLSAYGVWQEKSLYGRKFMGIVRSTFVLDGRGVVRAVFSPVKVAGHVDAVLDAITKTGGRA